MPESCRLHPHSVATVLLYDRATREPLTPGPATVERSSQMLPWDEFLVERHRLEPLERTPGVSTHYMLSVLRNGVAQVEYREGQLRGRRFFKRAGAITLTPVGPVPGLHFYDAADVTVCAFSQGFMRDVVSDLERELPTMDEMITVEDPPMARLSALLDDEAAGDGPSGLLYAESLARALALRFVLASGQDAKLTARAKQATGPLTPGRLRRVLDVMRADLTDPPNLRTLAEASGYSPHHFTRMFRAATGATPHGYLLQLRIRKAQELLQDRNRSLAEVALATGFSSQAHFTTSFRGCVGTTPALWRREATASKSAAIS